jgi:hypothetical protein
VHVTPAPAHTSEPFNALTPAGLRHDPDAPGNHALALFHRTPGVRPSPPLYGTVRRGRCQLRGTVSPTFVRLTRRALEGGRRNPRRGTNTFSMSTQDYTATSGRRERSSPSLSALCGHLRHCNITPGTATTSPTLLERVRTGRRHARRCASYPPPVDGTLEPAHGRRPDIQPLRHHPRSRPCTGTGLATASQQERDSPGQPSTPWHCTTCLYT